MPFYQISIPFLDVKFTTVVTTYQWAIKTLRPRQNGRQFADDTSKRIFLNENVRISIKIPLKFVHKGPINNISVLVQIMAWRRPGDKPLSEPMIVSLPTHIRVTRPQWWVLTEKNPPHVFGHQMTSFKLPVVFSRNRALLYMSSSRWVIRIYWYLRIHFRYGLLSIWHAYPSAGEVIRVDMGKIDH